MTTKDMRKVQEAIDKWRKEHSDIDKRRKAYLENIPKQVFASMAFEGEHVSLDILEEYLKTLKKKKDR